MESGPGVQTMKIEAPQDLDVLARPHFVEGDMAAKGQCRGLPRGVKHFEKISKKKSVKHFEP